MKLSAKGFSLLELLLVVSMIAIVAVFSVPTLTSYFTANNLDSSAVITVEALRKAHNNSRAMLNDDAWSVYLSGQAAIVYKGNNFVSRNQTYDYQLLLDNGINYSTTYNLNFVKQTGYLSSNQTIILNAINGKTKEVSINVKGSVTY